MAAPDMDVIKEIPGYKVILKAVLKSQIQQLVEQLASHTDEESVILTASVSDGTLSHLGSDSGHHKKKQEKDREEEILRMASMSPRHIAPRPPRMMSPRHGLPPHPIGMPRMGPSPRLRSPGVRHEPYSMPRQRRPPPPMQSATTAPSNQIIKIEPEDDESNQSAGDAPTTPKKPDSNSSQPTSPSSVPAPIVKSDIDDDSSSAIPNEASDLKFSDTQPAEGLGLDSDFSNLISGEQSTNPQTSTSATDNSDVDPNIKVKLEAISESDMELEITGVEPGRAPVSSQQDTSWGSNTSMGYDPLGATGGPSDMPGAEGYSSTEEPEIWDPSLVKVDAANESAAGVGSESEDKPLPPSPPANQNAAEVGVGSESEDKPLPPFSPANQNAAEVGVGSESEDKPLPQSPPANQNAATTFLCVDCGKQFKSNAALKGHSSIEHFDKDNPNPKLLICPFDGCEKKFMRKTRYEDHLSFHSGLKLHICSGCNKSFRNRYVKTAHEAVCSGKQVNECKQCGKKFLSPSALKVHERGVHQNELKRCRYCGQTYTFASSLAKHLKQKHS